MDDEQAADVADGETSPVETDGKQSLDPFPEVDRDADRSAAAHGSATAHKATENAETESADGKKDDGHDHTCDPDSPVPCQFH